MVSRPSEKVNGRGCRRGSPARLRARATRLVRRPAGGRSRTTSRGRSTWSGRTGPVASGRPHQFFVEIGPHGGLALVGADCLELPFHRPSIDTKRTGSNFTVPRALVAVDTRDVAGSDMEADARCDGPGAGRTGCGCTRWPRRGGNGVLDHPDRRSPMAMRVSSRFPRISSAPSKAAAFDASSARMAASPHGAMTEVRIVI